MDHIKEAFQKVKQDMDSLKQDINLLTSNLAGISGKIKEITEIIKQIKEKTSYYSKNKEDLNEIPTFNELNTSTNRQIIPTPSTHPSTHNLPLEALKDQNMGISIGNQGVSTDRQTDRQTDTYTKNNNLIPKNSIENAIDILNSLDSIKKEIRFKFKRLTEQELLVFSTIYQLDEENGNTNYKTLSKKLNLTESSIRDYIGRLIKKGIPIEKNKINNKNIQLSIAQNLKKIATLSTILQLRDL